MTRVDDLGIDPDFLQHVIGLVRSFHELDQGVNRILFLSQVMHLPSVCHALFETTLHLRHIVLIILGVLVADAAACGVVHEPPKRPHAVLLVGLALLAAARDARGALAAAGGSEATVDIRIVGPPRLLLERTGIILIDFVIIVDLRPVSVFVLVHEKSQRLPLLSI